MSEYRETLDQLDDPDSWDVDGIIRDASRRCQDHGDDISSAVIDWLYFQLRLAQNDS